MVRSGVVHVSQRLPAKGGITSCMTATYGSVAGD
jgi:hypothetical protein